MNLVRSVTLGVVIFAAQSTLAAAPTMANVRPNSTARRATSSNQISVRRSPTLRRSRPSPENTAMRLNRSRSRSSPRTLG